MRIHLNIIILAILFFACLAPQACQTPAGRSAGNVVDDSAITTKVKAKLLADNILSIFTISVKTFKGEVTLTGAVKTSEQKQRATAITQSVTGVDRINNFLRLK
jgi:hyperosmotically inducible periplasmic protein